MSWLDDFKKKEQRAVEESARVAREAEALAKKERDNMLAVLRENHIKIVNCAASSNIETYLLEFANEMMAWHPKCASDASVSRGMFFLEQKSPLTVDLWKKGKKVKPELLKNFSFKHDQVLTMLYWSVYLYSVESTWTPRSDNDSGRSTTRYGFFFSVTESGLFFEFRDEQRNDHREPISKAQIQEKIIQSFENPPLMMGGNPRP